MVDRAALEMRWAARSRGFESLPLRHLAKPNGVNAERSKLTPGGNRGGIGAKPQALGHSPEGTESIPPSPPSFALGASAGTANFQPARCAQPDSDVFILIRAQRSTIQR